MGHLEPGFHWMLVWSALMIQAGSEMIYLNVAASNDLPD